MPPHYRAADLESFARQLFTNAGCDGSKPEVMAEVLLEADLLGHTTHGLALVPGYLSELETSEMRSAGEPVVIADHGAAITWDANRLPGVWILAKAMDLCVERARAHGTATMAIRRSHHVACLAAYLERATRSGLMALIASSDPSDASVAPFGGLKAVFTPDPIGVGIPTAGTPILIDMSASITTNGLTNRLRNERRSYPGRWAMTATGEATDSPDALFTEPPGTLLPAGGQDHGHKGYGLALMVEALSQGLAGHGRADGVGDWGASLFVQVLDPSAFGGTDSFVRQTQWIAEACRNNPPAPGYDAVRLPGESALRKKRAALESGIELYPTIMPALMPWAEKLGVTAPQSMA